MSRVQTNDQSERALTPGAAPVNRFSTPEQPLNVVGPTKAMQISNALSDLVPSLLKFSANADQRKSEAEIQAARVERAKNAMTFQEAVKSGKISADQNPWFVKSWKEMDGSVTADRYNEDLLLAMSTGPLANSTDHNESTKLLDNFRTNWMQAHLKDAERDVVSGFQAKAAGYELNARAHQASVVGNNIVVAAGETFDHNIQGIISESYSRGISADAVAEGINREADKALLVGMSPQDVNKMVLKAAENDAMQNLDVNHAEAILNSVKGGPGGKLGGTTAAKNMLESVSVRIADELHQRDSWAHEEEVRKNQAIIAGSNTVVATAMLDAKIKGIPVTLDQFRPQIQAIYATGNWEQGQNLEKAIIASGKESLTEASFTKESLYVQVLAKHEVNFDRLNRALSAGEININTYKDLGTKMNEILADEKRDAKEPSFFKNPAYSKQGDFLDVFLKGDEKIFDAAQAAARGEANSSFWQQIYDWDKANPKATAKEQTEEARTVADQLKEDWRNSSFAGLGGTVEGAINSSPGVKAGRVTPGPMPNTQNAGKVPDKLPDPSEPAFKNADDFHRALNEMIQNPTGSQLHLMAIQHGMSDADFIAAQSAAFPEETPKPTKK